MTPRVILHIGQQKTGTTALQHTLIADRERLASLGILYPAVGHSRRLRTDGTQPSHNGVFQVLEGRRHPRLPGTADELTERFGAAIASASPEVIIISAERGFFAADQREDVLGGLDAMIPGPKDVVAYLRRPDKYLTSFHKHVVRMGEPVPPLHEPARLEQLRDTCQIDQRRAIETYVGRYGAVQLYNYDDVGDTVGHFYRTILGIDPPAEVAQRANPSIPAVLTNLALAHTREHGPLEGRQVTALLQHGERETVDLLGPTNRSRLVELFARHNAYLGSLVGRETFFADLDDARRAPEGSISVPEADRRYRDMFAALVAAPSITALRRDCLRLEHRGLHDAAGQLFAARRTDFDEGEIDWFRHDLEAASGGRWTIVDGAYALTETSAEPLARPRPATSERSVPGAFRRVLGKARSAAAKVGRAQ